MMEKKILVLDDEVTNVRVFAAMLGIEELHCDEFTDAEAAWQAIKTNPDGYSLLLTDRIMPKLNALQLLSKLKATPTTRALPVVVVTGLAERDEKAELFAAGAFDILLKPVERTLLSAVVKRALASCNET